MVGHYPTRIHGLEFKCDPDHISYPWRQTDRGEWEPYSSNLLSKCLTETSVFYDVGAWIGPITLYAARNCRTVVAFEPDPVALRYLLQNIELNGLCNVQVLSVALAGADGARPMASVVTGQGLGRSTTSLLASASEQRIVAPCFTLPHAIAMYGLPMPDIIKVDVEGGEFELVEAWQDLLPAWRPVLYLSTHAQFLPEAQRLPAMTRLANVLATYKQCKNEEGRPVDIADLVSSRSLTQCRSFLLED